MSLRTRNPFKIRRSEKIDSDSTFLRIYSPIILEDFAERHKDDKLWNDLLFIRSSPGAGKSSLLRIFEPATLVTLHNSKSSPQVKDLRDYLKKIDVIDNDKVKLLGVCLHCNKNYEILEDLHVDDAKKKRFFFALINARIVMTTLRGLLTIKRLSFPQDLDKITINTPDTNFINDVSFPCTGALLYDWAINVEKKVYKALDSFLPIDQIQPEGHSELFTLRLLVNAEIKINNEAFNERMLFMFDDAHKLSGKQRDFLIKYIIEQRNNFSIWVSERLEALTTEENLKSYQGRDYNELNLEAIWQTREAKFKSIVSNIAFRRAAISTEDVPGFDENLEANINEEVFKTNYQDAYEKSITRLNSISEQTTKFNEWLNYVRTEDCSDLERAILTRSTEIIVHRNLSEQQTAMEMEIPSAVLKASIISQIENAAEYFISLESKLPYYYSFDKLVQISSFNIDQFLHFAGELYEAMLSNRIARKATLITTEEQQRIIMRVVNDKWKELSTLIPYSEVVKKFLQKFHEFAYKESNRPTFPYAPGVTGFALKPPASNKLIQDEHWLDDEVFIQLSNVLSTCVSFNLLEKRTVNHGKKGSDPTTVYYLNRWLCVRFNLPLGYGGWRSIKPEDLLKWTKIT
ncbi:MAG: hypothetical protein JST82_13815 [Bacteroidetes bacterium]|nr:hypothetical protein [Bacteroidota bacterium]